MATRKVVGQILTAVSDSSPWKNGRLSFQLESFGFESGSEKPLFPKGGKDVLTDEDGKFEIDLWVNENSLKESVYVCTLPSRETFRFILTAGVGSAELNDLATTFPLPPQPPSESFQDAVLASIAASNVPSSPTASGKKGQRIFSGGYIYECVATDTWRRYSANTF